MKNLEDAINSCTETIKDLNDAIKSCTETTDWLIRSIPGWERLKLKEFARLCGYFKLSFAKSKFTEKEWSKMLGIKKRTIHKLLHDPVPKMNIETYFKLRYFYKKKENKNGDKNEENK